MVRDQRSEVGGRWSEVGSHSDSYFIVYRFRLPIVGPIKLFYGFLYKVGIIIQELWFIFKKTFFTEPIFHSICHHIGKNLWIERIPYVRGSGKIFIGHDVTISGSLSIGFGNQLETIPNLKIGDNTFIGHNVTLRIASSISIGSNCFLAGNTKMFDVDGHPLNYLERRRKKTVGLESVSAVTIEDDVWLGTNVIILKGVKIGARSVVGAGSVVTKSVPQDSLVVGNPAKIIGILNR